MYEHLREMAKEMQLRRRLKAKAIFLVANRAPPPAPEPPVINLSPTIVVQASEVPLLPPPTPLVIPAPLVTVNQPEMRPTFEVTLPPQEIPQERIVNRNVDLSVSTLVVQATTVVLKVAKLEQTIDVSLPPQETPATPSENFCPPEKKAREIIFTRDRDGNIISAREV